MSTVDVLSSLFEQYAGIPLESLTALPRAGSNRVYYRITGGGKSAIGAFGSDPRENRAFLTLAACLRKNGVAAPEIYAEAPDGLHYLQEDLGNLSLFALLHTPEAPGLLQQAMAQLAHMQVKGAQGFDWSNACPTSTFDERTVCFDLHYFKYNFLKCIKTDFNEWQLEDDFDKLAACLLQCPKDYFMYRDFQSRNIMVRHGALRFIDFQGARRGPLAYDVASFLFQSRARFSDAQRETLLHHYIDCVKKLTPVNRSDLVTQFYTFGFFRGLQTLGTYGYRGLFEKKALFRQSIPATLNNLQALIRSGKLGRLKTGYLFQLVNGLHFPDENFPPKHPGKLTVTVHSFSFRNGYPDDTTEHGGGFVFDCRGLVNPGAAPEFRNLTGRDRAVADYLAQQPDVSAFLQHTFVLLDRSVARYMERGFTHLSVAFGCTGGQHRSVYCAEQMAAYLAGKYNVDIRLVHREQRVAQFIPAP
ncbi:MAG: phosphotransferase [Prevotellaceae bacterium]|jgi:aminoglycoside/choline kinase family phosphotransferase|nr:phosphotransferase [Prevotellaceae bacterium]